MKHFVLFCAIMGAALSAAAAPNGMVMLLTDYGADSIYVGVLKGAIYTKFPNAKVDSISHSIPPFDIVEGAYMLLESSKEFPKGTVFCCIVDPGVGTPRKGIVLETAAGQYFVGPDNGLMSLVAERDGVKQIRETVNTALWRSGVTSSTFHGRDIFGPVAAAVASGTPLDVIGPEVQELTKLDIARSRVENGLANGTVIRADVYGNLVTNITAGDLETLGIKKGDTLLVSVGDKQFTAPFVSTYGDVPKGEKLVCLQSSGKVECAINLGSLAETLGTGLHAAVTVRRQP